ncbi:MAG TPA: hypothetical protein PLB18_01685 [Acidobacteriota bacterium]|nr:hypothetical protein [Acidobacteriota bacterium]
MQRLLTRGIVFFMVGMLVAGFPLAANIAADTAETKQSTAPPAPTNLQAVVTGGSVNLSWDVPPALPPTSTVIVKPAGLDPDKPVFDDLETGIRAQQSIKNLLFGEQITPPVYPATLKSVLYLSISKSFDETFPLSVGANFKLWVFNAPTGSALGQTPRSDVRTYNVSISKEPVGSAREYEDFNEFTLPENYTITSGSFFVALQWVDNGTSQINPDGSLNYYIGFDRTPPSTGIISTDGGNTFSGVGIQVFTPSTGTVTADFPMLGRLEVVNPTLTVTGYKLYRSTTSPVMIKPENLVATLPAGQTTYADTPPMADGTVPYFYALSATYNSTTESALSNEVAATPGVNDTMAPVVEVFTPNGGSVVTTGDILEVTWSAEDNVGLASHDIDLSTDSGATFSVSIATGLEGDLRSFQYEVPDSVTTRTARIRVTAKDGAGNAGSDASDTDFIIRVPDSTPPTVQVVSPNGGEKLKSGVAFNISWQATDESGIESQDVLLSTDSGATFPTQLATGLAGGTLSFSFTPNVTGKVKTARVRVVALDTAGNSAQDDSNGNFQIKGKKK